MTPVLYDRDEIVFNKHGLGSMPEWISLEVTEERNGEFFLEGELPVGARNADKLALERIIGAAPSPGKPMQYFEVTDLKSDGNTVRVNAHHVSYRLTKFICRPPNIERHASAQTMMDRIFGTPQTISTHIIPVLSNHFVFYSDIVLANAVQFDQFVPLTVREVLSGSEKSLVKLYGGELEWDGWIVKLLANRGADNGVTIRYGLNLRDIEYGASTNGIVTAYLGWWADENGANYMDSYLEDDHQTDYQYDRAAAVDLSQAIEPPEGETKPTQDALDEALAAYVEKQTAYKIPVSITFDAVPQALSNVHLCDTVTVIHPGIGIKQKAKVVKTVFNPITERYTSVTIGEIQKSIADTILGLLRK